ATPKHGDRGSIAVEPSPPLQRSGKQDVVLEVDVIHELTLELEEAQIQSSPRGAGVLGRGEIGGELARALEGGTMIAMLGFHDTDRSVEPGSPVEDHREQNPLLLAHVRVELVRGPREMICEPEGTAGL